MRGDVLFHVATIYKNSPTDRASILPLPGVNVFVLCQRFLVGKSLRAELALEVALGGVSAILVSLQTGREAKAHTTHIALVSETPQTMNHKQ
jgi:hypothetical protein